VKLTAARNEYYSGEIDVSEYKLFKSECAEKVRQFEVLLEGVVSGAVRIEIVEKGGFQSIQTVNLYKDYDSIGKRQLITYVFPEKLSYDGEYFRTVLVNECVDEMFRIAGVYGRKKAGN